MAKVKHVGVTVPRRRENGHRGIKARDREFQDTQKKIVAVVGFKTKGSNCKRNLGFGVGRSRGRISMNSEPTSAYLSVPSPGGQRPSKLNESLMVSKVISGRR